MTEPVAAALAHDIKLYDEKKVILVFDLGGGTFDVSVVSLQKTEMGPIFVVKAIYGDSHLGGEDFDNNLAHYLLQSQLSDIDWDLTDERGKRDTGKGGWIILLANQSLSLYDGGGRVDALLVFRAFANDGQTWILEVHNRGQLDLPVDVDGYRLAVNPGKADSDGRPEIDSQDRLLFRFPSWCALPRTAWGSRHIFSNLTSASVAPHLFVN